MESKELKEIRKLSGLSQSEFGRRIRATLGQISVWERGIAPVPAWAEENVAREFSGSELAAAARSRIPVIGYVSAGETDVHYDDQGFATGGGFDEVERPAKVKDPHAYALRVKGDSMFPAYREGDTLVLDSSYVDDPEFRARSGIRHRIGTAVQTPGLAGVIINKYMHRFIGCPACAGERDHGAGRVVS